MNDDTQDKTQTNELRQRLYNDLPEEHNDAFDVIMHSAIDTMKRSLATAPDDVTKLKNPFTVKATGSYRPYGAEFFPEAAAVANVVDEREQKIKNLEDEVAGLNYHLAEAKDRLQQIECSHHMLQMEYVELKSKIELLEKMLRL